MKGGRMTVEELKSLLGKFPGNFTVYLATEEDEDLPITHIEYQLRDKKLQLKTDSI
jgi:hypothetical protein